MKEGSDKLGAHSFELWVIDELIESSMRSQLIGNERDSLGLAVNFHIVLAYGFEGLDDVLVFKVSESCLSEKEGVWLFVFVREDLESKILGILGIGRQVYKEF